MATIKAIDGASVHRIQSGQVIVDLCSVAKELIENSVDAGASVIDVRFKNQGLDSIEVQDNGSGISPDNHASVALKHYTSKLSVYDDLSDLQTFGFRGEALSSLSALSNLSIITCLAADAPRGTKLTFASSGAVEDTSVVPAKQGTTVTAENLFHNLPVRRRELQRHIKREWSKVISLLNQYACILTGVKFTVSQQPTKGKRIVLFSTKGNPTTRENIINIFGAKTMTALIPLDLTLEIKPTSAVLSRSRASSESSQVTLKGHVSKPAHGEGRQAPDRQMFFVNGRPCGLPQFAKVFNEVYRAFNSSQSPFIFADIRLDTHMYDVNVSPDKRTILLHEQGRMLEDLKESLNAMFEAQEYTVPASQLATQRTPALRRPGSHPASTTPSRTGDTPDSTAEDSSPARGNPAPGVVAQNHDDEQDMAEAHLPLPDSEKASQNPGSESPSRSSLSDWLQQKASSTPKPSPRMSPPPPKGTPNSDALGSCSMPPPSLPKSRDYIGTVNNDPKSPLGPRAEPSEQASPRVVDERDGSSVQSGAVLPGFQSTSSLLHSRKRTAPDVATVTIGDHTVTSPIGSYSKRRRGESPVRTSSVKSTPSRSPMPSFGSRLSQLFSAGRSQNEPLESLHDGEGDSSTTSEVDDPDQEAEITDRRDAPETDDEMLKETQGPEEQEQEAPRSHSDSSKSGSPAEVPRLPSSEGVRDGTKELDEESTGQIEAVVPTSPVKARTPAIRSHTRKEATLPYEQSLRVDAELLRASITAWESSVGRHSVPVDNKLLVDAGGPGTQDAEEKLTLTISKGDFNKMKVVGQFNLGFILAVRPSCEEGAAEGAPRRQDELFIVDQHASDEKYNFERLQAQTVVESQRLVHPKTLDLTALEEEIVLSNLNTLEANGFKLTVDQSGDRPVGARCQLLALPLSKETTFTLADLEELISLLGDSHATSETTAVPRPSKVRKMFAMRACRSSIMIGSALRHKQMEKLVRHMGELDKPWNCPHGRPTMRHLCSLGAWDDAGWEEDGGPVRSRLAQPWADYLGG